MFTAEPALSTLAISNVTLFGLPAAAALAAVALIGYLFGQRTRATAAATALDGRRQQELDRAVRTAKQLENIADTLRGDLVTHHAQLAAFKRRLRQVQHLGTDAAWEHLCNEAEAMLSPTMQLAQQLSHAYDQIRQQSDALETFTRGRTDPLTGVGNGRALEQQLRVLLTAAARGNSDFAVALVSLDRDGTTAESRSLPSVLPMLPRLASVIRACMRDSDFAARYGDDEFVVVMPQTSLSGARVFSDRLRRRALNDLSSSVCCGLTEVHSGDDARALLARADSALYSAKAAGSNRTFVHTGVHIREHFNAPFPTEACAAEELVEFDDGLNLDPKPVPCLASCPPEIIRVVDASHLNSVPSRAYAGGSSGRRGPFVEIVRVARPGRLLLV